MTGARRVSMGDPVRVLPLRQRIAWVMERPGLAAGAPAAAYDVGRGVVMLTPVHPLHVRLLEDATGVALSSPGRVDEPAGGVAMCRHLEDAGEGAAVEVHLVAFEPGWALCPGCARGLLGEWVGDRRSCAGCREPDRGGRLRLVRVPSQRSPEGSLVDAWVLLCPRCLGPVATCGAATW